MKLNLNINNNIIGTFVAAFLVLLSLSVRAGNENLPEYVPMLIEVESEDALDEMVESGAEVWRRRGDMALVLVPKEDPGERELAMQRRVSRRRGIGKVERSRRMTPAMDIARMHFGADSVGSGEAFGRPYTGKGVVVGFCDLGFDPMHLNFLDSTGRSRVGKFVRYDERHGVRKVAERDEMAIVATDDSTNFHATHVCGIMAGATPWQPYTGMAPGAEIVATTSSLYDVGILAGLEDIIDYARDNGKPAVINMSLSDQLGPRDGTSLESRWLDMAGEEAIIVISAGNAGNTESHLRFESTAETDRVRVRFHSLDWKQFDMNGAAVIWGDDGSPLYARLLIYDEQTGKEVYAFPPLDMEGDAYMSVDSGNDPEFARYFSGSVEMAAEVNPSNGRMNILILFDASTSESSPAGDWARYNLGLETGGAVGTGLEMFSDASGIRLVRWPGYPATDSRMSINDMVMGDNIISVGMYVNRDSAPYLGGGEKVFRTPLHISSYSSYGLSPRGETLPVTVAPGHGVISSYSRAYIAAAPGAENYCSAVSEVGGEKYYWGECVGTSMSAPYVAGCIAQWLEANPTLTARDVRQIIRRTNRRDYPDPDNPRHGGGWFDPVEGMREVLALAATETPVCHPDPSAPLICWRDGKVSLRGCDEDTFISVHDISGRLVCAVTLRPGSSLDLNELSEGMYIVSAAAVGAIKIKL